MFVPLKVQGRKLYASALLPKLQLIHLCKGIIVLENLKTYISMGWPLFPCRAQGQKAKAPLTAHGFLDASLDWKQIEQWYQQFPGCAWGVATSAERTVLDVDVNKGGSESLAQLVAEYGELPSTPKVITGSGGFHYWLRCPVGTSCGKPYPGIDRKADGGYVIVPPSQIAIPEHQGRAYAWAVRPWEVALAEAPAWLLTMKPKAEAKGKAEAKADADPWIVKEACADLLTHPGCDKDKGEHRPPMLCRLVGVHIARDDSPNTIYALAEAWASRCNPPLEDWRKHVDGLLRKEEAKAEAVRMTPLSPPPSPQPGFIALPEAGREGTNSEPKHQPSAEAISLNQAEAEAVNPNQASAETEKSELVCSLPPFAENEQGGEEKVVSLTNHKAEAVGQWPTLGQEAYHGLFGEMLKATSGNTEADPAGVLLGWLTCFGSVVGRGAWVTVGPRKHYPALYVGIVGKSSDAKGDSWAASLHPFRAIEPAWANVCIANGVGSGEGLVERIADAQQTINKKGEVEVIPGASDKRCLFRLSELSQCFKRGRRENATLRATGQNYLPTADRILCTAGVLGDPSNETD
jgi:bifunctional DNA primase/polymerase-like protein